MQFDKADLLHLAQTALFGVIGVLALLLVLRPMVLRITSVAPAGARRRRRRRWPRSPGPHGCRIVGAGRRRPWRAGAPPPLLEDESMVNIAQIEGQMRASSLRRIGELVEKHPEETLSIMRGWMVQENS